MDLDYLIDEVIAELFPLNCARLEPAVRQSLTAVAATAEHHARRELFPLVQPTPGLTLRSLKASAALPIVYGKIVEFGGEQLVDGGFSDPVPLPDEFDSSTVLVVLTRPMGSRKGAPAGAVGWLTSRLLPRLYADLVAQATKHNACMERVADLAATHAIAVIAPTPDVMIDRLEWRARRIKALFSAGVRSAEDFLATAPRWGLGIRYTDVAPIAQGASVPDSTCDGVPDPVPSGTDADPGYSPLPDATPGNESGAAPACMPSANPAAAGAAASVEPREAGLVAQRGVAAGHPWGLGPESISNEGTVPEDSKTVDLGTFELSGLPVDIDRRAEIASVMLQEYAQCGEFIRWCATQIFIIFGAVAGSVGFLVQRAVSERRFPTEDIAQLIRNQHSLVGFAGAWVAIGAIFFVLVGQALRINNYWVCAFRRAREIERVLDNFYRNDPYLRAAEGRVMRFGNSAWQVASTRSLLKKRYAIAVVSVLLALGWAYFGWVALVAWLEMPDIS